MTRRTILPLVVLLALVFSGAVCPTPHPPTPPLVKVAVCGESLLLPNSPYCPDVVVKEFQPDAVPTKVCTLHVAPPDPPVKTKVAEPWHPGGELRAWSGGLYGLLSGTFVDEAKLDALDEAMAVDGIQATREFTWYTSVMDGWAGAYLLPWNADWSWNQEYWSQLDRRLQMWCGDRDGTMILSLLDACSLYAGDSWEVNPLNKLALTPSEVFWPGPAREKVIAFARELVRRTAKYAGRIIWETRNEGAQIVGFDGLQSYDRAVIAALKAEGVPVTHIATNWYDSSLFYDTILNDLEGKGLAFTHQINSEGDANWYRDSPGKQGLAKLGDRPSADGPSFDGLAAGLKWFWLPGGQGRRASNSQIAYVMAVMRGIGFAGYEFLSAAAFQHSVLPDLDDAINLGHAERLAMKGN